MTVSHTRHLSGVLVPADDRALDPEAVRVFLRRHSVLGSVVPRGGDDGLAGEAGGVPVGLTVAADSEQRVLLNAPDGPAPGLTVGELAGLLVREFGAAVWLGDEYASGLPEPEGDGGEDGGEGDEGGEGANPGGEDGEDSQVAIRRPRVLITSLRPEYLGAVAKEAGSAIRAAEVDGRTIIQLTSASAGLEYYLWFKKELPVIGLGDGPDGRSLGVLCRRGLLPGHVLSRMPAESPSFGVEEVHAGSRGLVEGLVDPHLRADSALRGLLAEPMFRHLDFGTMREALQRPDDERYLARLLVLLGQPVVAAEVFESGAPLPGSELVEPTGAWKGLVRSLDRYVDDAPGRARSTNPFTRWAAAGYSQPRKAFSTIVPEALAGAAGVAWALTAEDRPGWLTAVGVVGALLILDAVLDAAIALRTLRRRGA
ncbi:hypothetical protein ACX8Z9_07565 [Arthrobacter halodurans]|uniref:Uncharacterized protein n=1 Tax=Arthrobacter halodurans TaxID=516699 RepID=A0ABV4UN24_9MICC